MLNLIPILLKSIYRLSAKLIRPAFVIPYAAAVGKPRYPTGEETDKGEPVTNTVNFVDDDQTTIATKFADDPSIGLQFVTPFINGGAWKDFSDYDWTGYASEVGYLGGDFSKNKGAEETTEDPFGPERVDL